MARKTLNRKRHRSALKDRRTRRVEKIRHSHVLDSLAAMIRAAERRRRATDHPAEASTA